jgi:hypothetical protein
MIRPAQGAALGNQNNRVMLSAQRANRRGIGPLGRINIFYMPVPQGDALGWMNRGAFGPLAA